MLAVRNREKAVDFISRHGYRGISIIDAAAALQEPSDILCPCAAGGVITREDIPNLKCRYLWGAANNQLKAGRPEDELEMAQMLADRDILYQPEWWHNCAGIMCGAEEYYYDGDQASLQEKIRNVLPQNTKKILQLAREQGVTPAQACYDYCDGLLH